MKFILKKPMVFGNSVENESQEKTEKGTEIFIDSQFKKSHNLQSVSDFQNYRGSWGWFTNKNEHLCAINLSDVEIKA